MSRLGDIYKNEIMDAMMKKFGYKNKLEVPKLEKIVVNMGVGEAKENAKILDAAIADHLGIDTFLANSYKINNYQNHIIYNKVNRFCNHRRHSIRNHHSQSS